MGIIIVVLVIIFIVWKIKKIKDVQNEQEIYCLRCGSSQVHIKTRGYSFGNFVVSTILVTVQLLLKQREKGLFKTASLIALKAGTSCLRAVLT